jgi:hypothetical protein
MESRQANIEYPGDALPNGPAGAAILAAGTGCAAVGIFAIAAEASAAIKTFFNFYDPVGPLSGVTAAGIAVWIVSWYGFHLRWRTKTVALAGINLGAFIGLAIGLLLTFPPFMDLLLGK